MTRRYLRIMVRVSAMALLLFAQTLALSYAQDKPKDKAPVEDEEVKLGRMNAEQNDKEVKLVTDPAVTERVTRIGKEIAAVANVMEVPAIFGTSNVKKFDYTFKVVDDKDVNAYSLPGGFIYVNKGLLDYVHSDDELAGVLAHEVSHAAHHHMMKLIKEQEKIQQHALIPLLLLAVFSKGGSENVGNLLMAGQLYMVAKLNTYGVEAEEDADQTAVHYLVKTKYNPVGILTFMERLAKDELRGPTVEMGIYKTHPPSAERAESLLAELTAMKIPINRRSVDPGIRADVAAVDQNGVKLAEVKMNKVVVARVTDSGGVSANDRAKSVADKLNTLFDQGLSIYEVRISKDKTKILAANTTLLTFTPDDALAQKTTIPQLTQDTLLAIQNLIWQDGFNRVTSSLPDK